MVSHCGSANVVWIACAARGRTNEYPGNMSQEMLTISTLESHLPITHSYKNKSGHTLSRLATMVKRCRHKSKYDEDGMVRSLVDTSGCLLMGVISGRTATRKGTNDGQGIYCSSMFNVITTMNESTLHYKGHLTVSTAP